MTCSISSVTNICQVQFIHRVGTLEPVFFVCVGIDLGDKKVYSPQLRNIPQRGRGIDMKINELILQGMEIVNELVEAIEDRGIGLKEVEERILEYVNQLGGLMVQEVVERVSEPLTENRVYVEGEEAVYDQSRNLRFRNRFGGETVRKRRCYKFLGKRGGYYPLDEKLGLDKCGGFSPLLTFLQVLFGASRPFEESSELLSKVLGFGVSATAVQWNTENAGGDLSDDPYRVIGSERRRKGSDVMIVEMDSTTSPQIHQEEGIRGRESLKQPTEWKMCHVGTIQKFVGGEVIDEWSVARYGSMEAFGMHLGRAALAMGFEGAEKVVFLSDGLRANWQICFDHFPGAIQILDFYHASEHLGDFCKLSKDSERAQEYYRRWNQMLFDGEVLHVMAEMKGSIDQLLSPEEGWDEYRYFQNNVERMKYEEYRAADLPIGSGKVEGRCKFIVGKRFKGSGMRWKKEDNVKVLRARMAKINKYLESHYSPKPRSYTFLPLEKAA